MSFPVRSSRALALSLLLSAAIEGCSGAAPTPSPAALQSTAAVTPQPTHATTASARPQVGSLDEVLSTNATVDATDAFEKEPILAGSVIATDGAGSAVFSMPAVIRRCTLSSSSQIVVAPSSAVSVQFVAGTVTCQTVKSGQLILLEAGHQVRLSMTDPVLVVTVGPDSTVVRVAQGMVGVTAAGGQPVYVGPALEAEVKEGAGVGTPTPFSRSELPPDVLAAVEASLGTLVVPGLTRPDPSGSTTLANIFERGSFLIGIDDQLVADAPALQFVNAYRDFQARHWDVGIDTIHLPAEEGLSAITSGKIALFVGPASDATVLTTGTTAIPLFTVANTGPVDLFVGAADPVFAEAERSLLRALVSQPGDTGDPDTYASFFRSAFDQEPDYASLAGLFGLAP